MTSQDKTRATRENRQSRCLGKKAVTYCEVFKMTFAGWRGGYGVLSSYLLLQRTQAQVHHLHMAPHSCLQLHSRGFTVLFWLPWILCAHGSDIDKRASINTHTNKNKLKMNGSTVKSPVILEKDLGSIPSNIFWWLTAIHMFSSMGPDALF